MLHGRSRSREEADAAAIERLQADAAIEQHNLDMLLDRISEDVPEAADLIDGLIERGTLADAMLEAFEKQ